jgi:hypothetical protein
MPVAETLMPMLAVYRYGLAWGLVTREQVFNWADSILTVEDTPDYFFIQLSMARSVDELIGIIESEWKPNPDALFARVLIGLLYTQLQNGQIAAERVLTILDEIKWMDVLRWCEDDFVAQINFEREFHLKVEDTLHEDLLDWLVTYQDFTLQNPTEWPAINEDIEQQLDLIEKQREGTYKRPATANYPVKKRLNGIWVVMMIVFAAAVFNIVFTCFDKGSAPALVQLKSEAWVIGFLVVFFGFCFLVVKGIYYLLRRLMGN